MRQRNHVGISILFFSLLIGCAPLNQARPPSLPALPGPSGDPAAGAATRPAAEPAAGTATIPAGGAVTTTEAVPGAEAGAITASAGPGTCLNTDDTFIALALSGGGTRAAALSYGVLEALRAAPPPPGSPARNLSDEVDLLSSVSGGSFTAAYFALFGDRIFLDFRERFLDRNVELSLAARTFTPPFALRHISPYFSRIDASAEIYDRIFDGKVYADLYKRPCAPRLVVNATEMALGVTFEFTPEQFENIGSDLSSYPISRAAAASSALPFLLMPITLRNYGNPETPQWVTDAIEDGPKARDLYRRAVTWKQLSDASSHPWIHLLDGGLADNIGARHISRAIVDAGGWINLRLNEGRVRRLLLVTVNAKASPDMSMPRHRRAPGQSSMLVRTSAVAMDNLTDESIKQLTQRIREYRENALKSAEEERLIREGIPEKDWSRHLAQAQAGHDRSCLSDPLCNRCYFPVPSQELEIYVVNIDLDQIEDPVVRKKAQSVGTRFNLPEDEVTLMIDSGRQLMAGDACYQRFLERSAGNSGKVGTGQPFRMLSSAMMKSTKPPPAASITSSPPFPDR